MQHAYKIPHRRVELQLPDGNFLRSRKLFESGGKFWRRYTWTADALDKTALPLYCGWTSGEYHVAAIDIDVLPSGFDNYEQVLDALLDTPGVTACYSPSNKVKGFICFRTEQVPSLGFVIHKLGEILPDSLKTAFDAQGVKYFLVNASMAEHLENWLSSEVLVFDWRQECRLSNIVSDALNPQIKRRFTYREATEVAPAFESFVNPKAKGADGRAKFVKILTAAWGLKEARGWSLSQRDMAEAIGVSQASLSAWIKLFQANGWLRKVSNSYIVGISALKYVAQGDLLEAIKEHNQNFNPPKRLPIRPPNKGEFYRYFLSLSQRIPTWEAYSLAVDSLPNITDKRRKQAKAVFHCDRRKSNKTACV